jgi:cysteine dioxygenase
MRWVTMGALVESLRTMPGCVLEPSVVAHALRQVALEPRSLTPYLWLREGGYARNVVYRDARFEVLVLCWAPGAASSIHDHAGQECWLHVEEGVLGFENFPLLIGGRRPGSALLGTPSPMLQAGVGTLDHRSLEEGVHRVQCLEGPAVSVHVYSRPISSCLAFDVCRLRCELRHLRDDTVNGVPATAPGGLQRFLLPDSVLSAAAPLGMAQRRG